MMHTFDGFDILLLLAAYLGLRMMRPSRTTHKGDPMMLTLTPILLLIALHLAGAVAMARAARRDRGGRQ